MIPADSARKRLDQLIRRSPDDDYASVSALIGKNHSYIQQYIQRGVPRRLREEDRRVIARHFRVPEWELGGPLAEHGRPALVSGFSESGNDGIVMIPAYTVAASAGFGAFVEGEWADRFLPFQAQTLRELTSSPPEDLTIITVSGDSMHPTLSDGDKILVDTRENKPVRDGIYVIRTDEALSVKRVSVHPSSGRITVKSDNPLYESWAGCKPGEIAVIGRVIWVGRNL